MIERYADLNLHERAELRDLLGSLLKHDGWKEVMICAEIQVKTRQVHVNQPLGDSPNATLRQEYEKGEMAGIELFMRLPQIVFQQLEELDQNERPSDEPDTD